MGFRVAPVGSIDSRVSPPFGPVNLSTVKVAFASLHKRPDGVITVVVSVVVSVVVLEESATPEDEEEQMGQHFRSHPDNRKTNPMRAKKRSEDSLFPILFKLNVLAPRIWYLIVYHKLAPRASLIL